MEITSAQTLNKFEPGRFTDDKGYVYNGLICIRPSAYEKGSKTPHILFKSGESGQKQSIPLQTVLYFVVQQDSFVTARMPNSAEYTWFRVVIDGPVKVYQTEIPGSGGGSGLRPSIGIGGGGLGVGMGGGVGISLGGGKRGSMLYVYGADATRVTELNRKNYVEILERAVADNTSLKGKIADKTYRYGDIEKLSEVYSHSAGR